MKVLISGGGTGGHIYPALAIVDGIKQRVAGAEILYVGTQGGMESTIVPRAGYAFESIDVSGLNRKSMLKASQSVAKFPKSIFQAWNVVKRFQPDLVIGTGGYVSFPVVFAGTLFPSCRTFIHEQNAYPGIANRHLAKRVNCTMLTFAEAGKYLHAREIRVTGLPVRKEFMEVSRAEAYRKMELVSTRFTLLIFGGSLGAASINSAMLSAVEEILEKDIQIIWITGNDAYPDIMRDLSERVKGKKTRGVLKCLPYLNNMEDAMACAQLAVCRSGASTLSELAVVGLPAILIPYPYAAENHQEKNARALEEKKCVDMVIDEFLDGQTLYKKIVYWLENDDRLREMAANIKREGHPEALNDILDIVLA